MNPRVSLHPIGGGVHAPPRECRLRRETLTNEKEATLETKEWRHGQFTWRELLCPDPGRARDFYGELFGWSFEDVAMPGGAYTIVKP